MKKLLITTLLAATVGTGFASQADASEKQKPYKVYTSVHILQLEKNYEEQVQKLFNEVYQLYKKPIEDKIKKLPIKVEEKVNKQPSAPEKQPEVKEPEKKPEEKQPEVKQPEVKQPEKQPEVKQPKEQPKVEQPKQQEEAPVQRPVTEAPKQQEPPKQAEEKQSSVVTQEEQQMVDLVNAERSKQGLAPLKINEELTKVARVKAQDMIDNNYFAHQSPTYGSPFDMLNQFGVEYRTAGENLAGNQTVEAAHQALMNSDGHRANILNSNYKEVGIGIVNGGPYGKMFVQLFKG